MIVVGEEGTHGYIGPHLILFGGATALERNSVATGPTSSGGNANCQKLLMGKVSDSRIAISHLILGKQASNRYSVEMSCLSWAITALVLLLISISY